MKKIKLFFNQRTQGGAVLWEKWELENIDNDNYIYGSGECLKDVTVEIPDDWQVSENIMGKALFDKDGCPIEITGDYEKVYALATTDEFPRKLKIV